MPLTEPALLAVLGLGLPQTCSPFLERGGSVPTAGCQGAQACSRALCGASEATARNWSSRTTPTAHRAACENKALLPPAPVKSSKDCKRHTPEELPGCQRKTTSPSGVHQMSADVPHWDNRAAWIRVLRRTWPSGADRLQATRSLSSTAAKHRQQRLSSSPSPSYLMLVQVTACSSTPCAAI